MRSPLPLIAFFLSAHSTLASAQDEAFGSKEPAGTGRSEIANDLQAFERVALAAEDAILAAERLFSRAQVVDIDFNQEDGRAVSDC